MLDDAALVLSENEPATSEEIGKIIWPMLLMYDGFNKLGDKVKASNLSIWRESMTRFGWPKDVLQSACNEWIDGERASFMPQPGDIHKICKREGEFRKRVADRAREFLQLTCGAGGEPLQMTQQDAAIEKMNITPETREANRKAVAALIGKGKAA